MRYRWVIAPPQPLVVRQLSHELRIPPLLAQALINRGLTDVETATRFLQPRLKTLSDPFALPNMTAAVDRLFDAKKRGEPLVIFGDYDVDGVTSTALLLEVLRRLGWTAHSYLPHRMDEGYGLSRDGVENCLKKFPISLLLAVDCGSTAVDTIGWLGERGVDVIVLDHHQVSSPAPAAAALVNPQLATPGEPDFRELCSVGLAFKLAHALVKRGRQLSLEAALEFDLKPLLDLVALGTVADIVPLTGENRILVSAGLERLNSTARPGLVALKKVAQVNETVGPYEIGFQLAPRLNAAGRLENAERALQLVLAASSTDAWPIAQELDSQNRQRQEIEKGIAEEVIGAVRASFTKDTFVVVEGQLLWHIGVVGIVASRVVREFYRPAIILGGDNDVWRGSGRSIEGFDLAAALRQCDDLLLRHGGHAMAAGLSVAPDKVPALRERLNEIARQTLTPEQLLPALRIDVEAPLRDLNLTTLDALARLAPHGQANPDLQLAIRGVKHARPPQFVGREQQHVKLRVTDGVCACDAIWWNAAERELPAGTFDLAVTPRINEFNGSRSVQLKVLDWRGT